jgi:hypothetical protein
VSGTANKKVAALRENEEKQETKQKAESRSQEPEEKRRESVNAVSAYSFWLLASAFWLLDSALRSQEHNRIISFTAR